MFSFQLFRERSTRRSFSNPSAFRRRPRLEVLDDRITPTVSSIVSNFNGTAIPAGSTLWFNSVLKVSGLGPQGATLFVRHGSVLAPAFGAATPDAVITFSPTATSAATAFDTGTNTWFTVVPMGLGGNTFLDGVAVPLPNGLPGGQKPVTWTADFTSSVAGVSLNWLWATAVYSSFSTDYTTVGVKPVDSNSASQYHNSDHAGTPENFKSFVRGGARGGGGSNFTGSYSATGHVDSNVVVEPPSGGTADIGGTVFLDSQRDGLFDGVQQPGELGLAGVEIQLSGVDVNGNAVTMAPVSTDGQGHYSFTGLPAGTYRLFENYSGDFDDGLDSVGTVGGQTRGTQLDVNLLGEIVLNGGDQGNNYNFSHTQPFG